MLVITPVATSGIEQDIALQLLLAVAMPFAVGAGLAVGDGPPRTELPCHGLFPLAGRFPVLPAARFAAPAYRHPPVVARATKSTHGATSNVTDCAYTSDKDADARSQSVCSAARAYTSPTSGHWFPARVDSVYLGDHHYTIYDILVIFHSLALCM